MRTRFFVVASTIASALAMAGCNQEAKAPEPVRPVLSAVLQPVESGSTVAVGTVQPRYETNLGFRVLGRLIARPVNVGDLVAEGQMVAAIDRTALEFAVQSARADLSKSQALLENAIGTEERKRILIKTDATTKQALDDAEQVRAGAQASTARTRANLTKAIEQLGYAEVKADFAGVVTAVSAEVGQVVSGGCGRYRRGLPRAHDRRFAVHRQLAAASCCSSPRPNSRNCAASRFRDAHAPRSYRLE